ncbi:MAG: hypothetical protein JNM52_07265 [Betaproteobacteria bacterium]|nr:hypothetical protein [Betaproteobacteria bacterium]
MLNEILHVTQRETGKYRRWFQDEFFDLYTWESYEGEMQSFQLCYDKSNQQRALRWTPQNGYWHESVDSPENKPGRAMSALFVQDDSALVEGVIPRFEAAALQLPAKIKNFVLEKIHDYQTEHSYRLS